MVQGVSICVGAVLFISIITMIIFAVSLAQVNAVGPRVKSWARSMAPKPNPSPQPPQLMLGGAGVLGLGAAGPAGAPVTSTALVMPLTWSDLTSEFMITFQIPSKTGNSTIQAAFDTGSAKLVVATDPSQSYSRTYAAPSALVQLNDAERNSTGFCSFVQSYGSQSVQVNAYSGTVVFPRSIIDLTELCSSQDLNATLASLIPPTPKTTLTLPNFPIYGAAPGSAASTPIVNVFGMCPVQTTQMQGSQFVTPACQLVPQAVYESQICQSFAEFYKDSDLIWTMMLSDVPKQASNQTVNGFVAFGQVNIPCLRPQFIDLVSTLPKATNTLTRTPFRYYVVIVVSCVLRDSSGDKPLGVPKYLMLDTGTTNVQLPVANTDTITALNGLGPGQTALLTLGEPGASVTLTWTTADARWGDDRKTFAPIEAGLAYGLSSDNDVGILGSTGMHNLFMEFNLSTKQVGFAQIVSTNA